MSDIQVRYLCCKILLFLQKVENMTDDEMVENWNISRREESKSLPYYHGLTSNYQARTIDETKSTDSPIYVYV